MRGRSREVAEPWRTKMVATRGQNKFARNLKQPLVRREVGEMVKSCAGINCENRWQSRKGGDEEKKLSFHK